MSIPSSFIQELLARADVVELVGRYVQLKKAGANYQGLCPFHGEKTPSFTVSPSKQFFHCFGCGKSGNAIGFLMDHAGMGFVEAVQDLAQQYGLQVPEDTASPQDRAEAAQRRDARDSLAQLMEKAASAYQEQLKSSPKAVDYLKKRGLSGEIAKRFGLGYAPEGWRHLASVFPHYDSAELEQTGLVIVSEDDNKRYDRFRDRIMFPIRNIKGECIGFGGRVLGEGTPKYLNSPETPLFSKGRELYGLFEAREALRSADYALVTEGYMDVVALAQLGFANAVATLGTACTSDHVQKLFRFTDQVIFSFDGDAAGQRAARRALENALPHASDTRSVKFLFLPPEHDPDSYVRAYGQEAFARCVSEATPLSRWLLDVVREDCDLATAEGRSKMAAQARPLWQALPQGALSHQLLNDLAELAQLGPRELFNLWQRATPQRFAPQRAAGPNAPVDGTPATPRLGRWLRGELPATSAPSRRAVPTRVDHALRLVLANSAAWEQLSAPEHALLCAQASPHGNLFAWVEQQIHEHGPQPWAALREGLRGHENEQWAVELVEHRPLPELEQAASELTSALAFMLDEQLKAQENEALSSNDLTRYQQVHAQRKALRLSHQSDKR